MRVFYLLLSLLFVAAGVLFGALNPQPARIDFYWFGLDGSLGALLLLAAFVGALAGGLALIVGIVLPQQRRLRNERRARVASARAEPSAPLDALPAPGDARP